MDYTNNTSALGQIATGEHKVIFNAGYEASLEYAEPKRVITPQIQLLFSPFGLPFIPIEIIGTNVNKVLTNLIWTKDRTNPGGMLQVEITPDPKVIEGIVNILNKYSANLYSKIWGELGVDLEDLFKPMTLCQLWIDKYHVATGYVRGCSRSSKVTNNSKQISYTVTIEELGNLYNLSTTSLDLIIEDGMQTQITDAMTSAMAVVSTLKGVNIPIGIQSIIEAFKATTLLQNITASDGFALAYRLLALSNPIGGVANTSIGAYLTLDESLYSLNTNGGSRSVWSFIQSFIPNPWMELFTESGGRTMVTDGLSVPSFLFPGFNYIVARTTPYTNPLIGVVNPTYFAQTELFDLTAVQMLLGGDFIIITDDMISEKNLGFDSANQSTVFRTSYGNHGAVNSADYRDRNIKCVGPLNPFASGGIPTFGIREMNQSIDCTSLIGWGVATSFVERIAKNIMASTGLTLTKSHLNNLLATWFRNQSRFREGTVECKGIPYARAGMYCLYLPTLSGKKVENVRDIGIYYIDSLTHNYSLSDTDLSFTTSLNLIRGVPLPTSVAQTALLLFDFEILPPEVGINDGEYSILKTARAALLKARGGI
jgi:hypothetical protein